VLSRRDYLRDFMMIPPGTDLPSVVNAIVEIPKGRRSKFEIDKATGMIKLDRYLYSSSVYPGDYGFIPQTLAEDGDPLDILVMVNEPTFSGCLIEARVVGMFRMKDKGFNDFKVLGVPNSDPLFKQILDLDTVPKHFLREVEHFFATYKQLEGIETEPLGWTPPDVATEEVRVSVDRFRASLGNVRG
jgi:inorganic pyrophosphatase